MSRRTRRRYIVLLALAGLLFQQMAIAAYACTMTRLPPAPVAMADDCGSMAMEKVREAPALCAKHCAPDQSVMPDSPSPGVPPLALPAMHFGLTRASIGSFVPDEAPPALETGPPPRLRYCSLLI